jgi:hypothetical protein
MNARLSEAFWDNPPYDTQSVTPDSHELSTYSIHPISQQEMPTASMPRGKPWDAPTDPSPFLEKPLMSHSAMPPQNGDPVPGDPAYKIQMETWEAYCVVYELWHVVEGFCVRQIGENIEVHGEEEFWGYPASHGLRGRELHSASMKWFVVSRGLESEIRGDMRDPDPKPQPQPQPQPSPHGDPWGYGSPHSKEVFLIKVITHSTGAFLAFVKADTPTVIRGLH